MSDIMERLGKVSARLSEEAFLSNKGLSNEVGIHVFCYAPEHEMTVRAYFANLKGIPHKWVFNTMLLGISRELPKTDAKPLYKINFVNFD